MVNGKIDGLQQVNLEPIQNIMNNIKNQCLENFKLEMDLCEFEVMYSVFIPKSKREENLKLVNKVRKELWNKCLKKANGDEEKALTFYNDI